MCCHRFLQGVAHEAGADGIELDVFHRRPKVGFIKHGRVDAVRPKMPRPTMLTVDPQRMTHMGSAHGQSQRVLGPGHSEQVDMVRHQAMGPGLKFVFSFVVHQVGKINFAIVA